MNIIFVEPAFPDNQRDFVRGLHAVGAHVIGIGERPADWLDDELRHWLGDYIQLHSVTDEGALHTAVRAVQDRLWVDRLEATVEAHVRPTIINPPRAMGEAPAPCLAWNSPISRRQSVLPAWSRASATNIPPEIQLT